MVNSTIVGDEGVSVFPKLMIIDSNDFIILVTGDDGYFLTGFVVYSTDTMFDVGHYSFGWKKSRFTNYHGSIVLKNQEVCYMVILPLIVSYAIIGVFAITGSLLEK